MALLIIHLALAGLVTTSFGPSSDDLSRAMVLQADGKIVVVGFSDTSGFLDWALARYHADGSLDPSFYAAGLVTTNFGGTFERALAVVLQSDGKIITAGFSNAPGNEDFALARYNTDGSLDSSFGTNGLVTTSLEGSNDRALVTVIQANGRIVAVGNSNASGTNNFLLVRYLIPSVTISPLARDLRAKYLLLQ